MLPTALGIFTENQWGTVDPNYLSTVNEILEMNGMSVQDAVKAVGIVKTIQDKFKKKSFFLSNLEVPRVCASMQFQ